MYMLASEMASYSTTKTIVKHLPNSWTEDHLLNYLEVTSKEKLLVAAGGIQVFPGITHSALITLEEPVTAETIQHVQGLLSHTPFQNDAVLKLQMLPSQTRSLLVHCPDSSMSRDLIFNYFDNPELSGCGDGYVQDCQMHEQVQLAEVHFSTAEALYRVIAKGDHRLMNGREAVKVEPWYEPFHRPLLDQLTGQRRTRQSSSQQLVHQGDSRGHRHPQVHENQRKPVCQMPAERRPQVHEKQIKPVYQMPAEQHPQVHEKQIKPVYQMPAERRPQVHEKQIKPIYQMPAEQHPQVHENQRKPIYQMPPERNPSVPSASYFPGMTEQQAESPRMERECQHRVREQEHVETEKLQRQQREMLSMRQKENQQLKRENEKLKNQTPISMPVPCYKYRLLKSHVEPNKGCFPTYLEQKEELVLYGTEEDCMVEKLRVLKHLQELADDDVGLPEPVAQILDSPRGRRYLDDLEQRHWGCSAELRGSHIMCAALTGDKLEDFKKELNNCILRRTCQVPVTLSQSLPFQALKTKLEKDYMVTVTCPAGDSQEDIHLDGLRGDVELAAGEMIQFTNFNRSGSKKFIISGALKSKACRSWFSAELDEVKQLILRNNGEIEAETKEGEYILTFQCRHEILAEVTTKLEAINSSIATETIDLTEEFPESSERPLLINGLYDMGVGAFCWQLEEKVKKAGVRSMGDFMLPEKCTIASFNQPRKKGRPRDRSQSRDRSPKRSHRHKKPHPSGGKKRGSRRPHVAARREVDPSDTPTSLKVGRTQISVKQGDITTEQVAAAVSILGPDLNPRSSAVSTAFLDRWPAMSRVLARYSENSAWAERGCRVVTTPTTHSHAAQRSLPMSTLLHAILSKPQKPDDVSEIVNSLVLNILQMATQKQLTSIAFPPLGVGKRFGFGRYATASAMMAAFQKFLQDNPGTFERITVVVYNDPGMADTFVKVMEKTFRRKRSRASSASLDRTIIRSDIESSSSNSTDSDTSENEDEKEEPAGDKFEAVVCAKRQEDCQSVKEMLLQELNSTFLWHETLRETQAQAFFALPSQFLQELSDVAVERNVLMTKRWHGKGVRLCGQKDKVQEMLLLIMERINTARAAQSQQERTKRRKLRLPEDTDHLPSYWRFCRGNQNVTYDKAIESWKACGFRFNFISDDEQKAVRQLVASTWELAKVGHGADAKGLKHSNIQVRKVERLENPMLWQKYSQKREQLFTKLIFHHKGQGAAAFRLVENLPNSSGHVRTTQNITERGPLGRFMFRQINEHYLFHGTKTDILKKICSEGLDDRMTGKAMLGRGVYLTESPTKADQYADAKDSRAPQGQELHILLVRVLLGEPYLHAGNPETFVRPPCYICKKKAHDCRCTESHCHDSVVFDSTKIFREFVVYDRDVCYPEYIITYIRK